VRQLIASIAHPIKTGFDIANPARRRPSAERPCARCCGDPQVLPRRPKCQPLTGYERVAPPLMLLDGEQWQRTAWRSEHGRAGRGSGEGSSRGILAACASLHSGVVADFTPPLCATSHRRRRGPCVQATGRPVLTGAELAWRPAPRGGAQEAASAQGAGARLQKVVRGILRR
jgi:hypothetical protein